jgi:hypothetical protein
MVFGPNEDSLEGIFRKPRQREKKFYHFDYAFGEDSAQEEIFDNTVRFFG